MSQCDIFALFALYDIQYDILQGDLVVSKHLGKMDIALKEERIPDVKVEIKPIPSSFFRKNEPVPEVKIEIEPNSVPIPMPFFEKEEPVAEVKLEVDLNSVPIPLPFFGKEELIPEVKLEVESLSVPNPLPFLKKEEPFEDKALVTVDSREKQKLSKSLEGRFHCEHCEYSSLRKANLVSHTRTHTGEKPYQCDECDYSALGKQ